MRRAGIWLWLVLVSGLCASPAFAQRPGSAVQLPTFSHFSLGTTVSVPDRGAAYMGGINRSASGRNTFRSPLLPFRPFKNSAIGSEQSAGSMHVNAWIHDFETMDQYLLSQPPRTVQAAPGSQNFLATDGRPASLDPAWRTESVIGATRGGGMKEDVRGERSQWASSPPPAVPMPDVAEEQRRREAQAETRSSEAEAFFLRGQEAEASGKANVARIYYQMAARRATGELQKEVLARLRTLAQPDAAGAFVRAGGN